MFKRMDAKEIKWNETLIKINSYFAIYDKRSHKMRQNLKKNCKFATLHPYDVNHFGKKVLVISQSENLENSQSNGDRCKAFSPVNCMSCCQSEKLWRIYKYGCEPIFILIASGVPEPSDEDVRGLTLCVSTTHTVSVLRS